MTGKHKKPEDSVLKNIGRALEVFALALLIINFVLWNMKDKDLGTIVFILVIANIFFFTGLVLSYLPRE